MTDRRAIPSRKSMVATMLPKKWMKAGKKKHNRYASQCLCGNSANKNCIDRTCFFFNHLFGRRRWTSAPPAPPTHGKLNVFCGGRAGVASIRATIRAVSSIHIHMANRVARKRMPRLPCRQSHTYFGEFDF
jgi:hypothetical protein